MNNNPVYTAMSEVTDSITFQGMIVDFRKTIGTKAWSIHRFPLICRH